jgi:hypothetical protein
VAFNSSCSSLLDFGISDQTCFFTISMVLCQVSESIPCCNPICTSSGNQTFWNRINGVPWIFSGCVISFRRVLASGKIFCVASTLRAWRMLASFSFRKTL